MPVGCETDATSGWQLACSFFRSCPGRAGLRGPPEREAQVLPPLREPFPVSVALTATPGFASRSAQPARLRAAFRSRSRLSPQAEQSKRRWLSPSSALAAPQREQVLLLGYQRSTTTSRA